MKGVTLMTIEEQNSRIEETAALLAKCETENIRPFFSVRTMYHEMIKYRDEDMVYPVSEDLYKTIIENQRSVMRGGRFHVCSS
jgi:hypothetical protein